MDFGNQATAAEISWKKRIEIQSICKKITTHSISSTINLPKRNYRTRNWQIFISKLGNLKIKEQNCI